MGGKGTFGRKLGIWGFLQLKINVERFFLALVSVLARKNDPIKGPLMNNS